jgi:hypothetical protein
MKSVTRRRKIIAVSAVFLLLTGSIFVYSQLPFLVMYHSPDLASQEAVAFATDAFVAKDYERAKSRLTPDFQGELTRDRFDETLAVMHSDLFPQEIQSIDYQPLWGQRAMNILLVGTGGKEKFEYQLLMIGTEPEGYRVGGFWRKDRPPSTEPENQ